MFRSLYENFQDTNPAIQELNQNITRYQSVEPNIVVINRANDYAFASPGITQQQQLSSNADLQAALNALGSTPLPTAPSISEPAGITNTGAVFTGLPDSLGERLKACRRFEGLPGLSNLINSQSDPTASERCGWRYKPGIGAIPQVAQGAYGNRNAPLDPAVPQVDRVGDGTQYIWDLKTAEKTMIKDICKSATNCMDLTAVPLSAVGDFSNVCGYCETSQKIIPIKVENGVVRARYTDLDAQCAPDKIITVNDAKRRCPPPPPESQEVGYWKCLNAGKLDRDCVTLSAYFAGCSPEGTLVSALSRGKNDQDYADILRTQKSFQTYQALSQTPLSEDVIRSGNATIFSAFMNNYNLNRDMYNSDNEKRWVAALDLCRYGGIYEQWNFCSDLKDGDKDYETKCMQDYFLQAGGSYNGSDFPNEQNKSRLKGTLTWGEYKASVNDLKTKASSRDPAIQTDALNRFNGLGLKYNPSTLPRGEASQGVEVLYFDWFNGVFLGRRPYLSAAGQNLPNFNVGSGEVEKTGLSDGVQIIYFFDFRPDNDLDLALGVVTDDGWAIAKNQQVFAITDWSRGATWWYDQGPTWHNTSPIKVDSEQKGLPNIFMGTWYERGGGAVFHPFYKLGPTLYDRGGQSGWIEIGRGNTPNWPIDDFWKKNCYFTQEIDAPTLQYEVIQSTGLSQPTFTERRMWPFWILNAERQTESNTIKGHTISTPVSTPLPKGTLALTLGNTSEWKLSQSIAGSAIRTWVICFNIRRFVKGNQTTFGDLILMSPSRGGSRTWTVRAYDIGSTGFVDMALLYSGYKGTQETSRVRIPFNTWHMCVVRLYPENSSSRAIIKMDFFIQTLENMQKGNILTGTRVNEIAAGNEGYIFNDLARDRRDACKMILGSVHANEQKEFQYAWVHGFDDVIPTSDTDSWKKEATKGWQGRWFD